MIPLFYNALKSKIFAEVVFNIQVCVTLAGNAILKP